MRTKPNNPKKVSDTFKKQIGILRALSNSTITGSDSRPVLIDDLTDSSGVQDEKEAQRILYILEGQKLVAPHPAGDFTSRHWQITPDGVRALKSVANVPL